MNTRTLVTGDLNVYAMFPAILREKNAEVERVFVLRWGVLCGT